MQNQSIKTLDSALNSLGKYPEGSNAVYASVLASHRANLSVLEARKAA